MQTVWLARTVISVCVGIVFVLYHKIDVASWRGLLQPVGRTRVKAVLAPGAVHLLLLLLENRGGRTGDVIQVLFRGPDIKITRAVEPRRFRGVAGQWTARGVGQWTGAV